MRGKNYLAASYFIPRVSCSRVGLKPAGLSPWLVSGWVLIRVPLLLLTSRCSAVMKRRMLLLREVACRSSKEKATPHAGDQSEEEEAKGGGGVHGASWQPRKGTLQAGQSVLCAPGPAATTTSSVTEDKDTAHFDIFIRTESYHAWQESCQKELWAPLPVRVFKIKAMFDNIFFSSDVQSLGDLLIFILNQHCVIKS